MKIKSDLNEKKGDTGMNQKELKRQLDAMSEETYKKFQEKLTPGETGILGVRVPRLRDLAKKAAREDGAGCLRELHDKEELLFEELMIYGLLIGYTPMELSAREEWLDLFVPRIRNWAVCDTSCATYKFMSQNKEFWFSYLKKYIYSKKEYQIRFALVCFLDYFTDEEHIDEILEICGKLRHEGYYVKMAAAWLISVCYIKFPEKVKAFLKENRMDSFTHNKAIQKIRESYRVSHEEKEELKNLKRKGQ